MNIPHNFVSLLGKWVIHLSGKYYLYSSLLVADFAGRIVHVIIIRVTVVSVGRFHGATHFATAKK